MTAHPWRTLREMPEVEVYWTRDSAVLDGAQSWWYPQQSLIVMDSRLRQVQRRCALAHELAHRERDDGPCSDDRSAWRQEVAADRYAARWLIDIEKLGDAIVWAHSLAEAADELWVTGHMLQVRLDALHPAERHHLRRRIDERDGSTDPESC